jgi:hypothetical protein
MRGAIAIRGMADDPAMHRVAVDDNTIRVFRALGSET